MQWKMILSKNTRMKRRRKKGLLMKVVVLVLTILWYLRDILRTKISLNNQTMTPSKHHSKSLWLRKKLRKKTWAVLPQSTNLIVTLAVLTQSLISSWIALKLCRVVSIFYPREIRKKSLSSRIFHYKSLMMTHQRFLNQQRDLTKINFLLRKSLLLEENLRNRMLQWHLLLKTRKQPMNSSRNMREKSIRQRAY